ncbi:MAG TPA: hypothetical protein VEX37_04140 [Thermomicrobiales bacterium]|nr:hypothetical protein [Thermomicrobiales bacterium]
MMNDDASDRSLRQRERRTFSADRKRTNSLGLPRLPVAEDWRDRVPPAVVRVLVGATFIALPDFQDRLGSVALPLICVVLAILTGVAGSLLGRSEAQRSWSLNATDAVSLLLLVPVVAVASGIEVADIRLGGATGHFVAAALAVLAVVAIVTVVAILASVESPLSTGIALLPAALIVAATIAAAERFAADNLGQGLTAAWMIAALATLLDGALSARYRSLVPPIAFATFAIVVAVAGNSGGADVSRSNAAIAFLTTAASGAALLLAPAGTLRARLFVTEPIRTRVDR